MFEKDPFGHAIHDYVKGSPTPDIIVRSELCEDDSMEVELLFRDFEEMPELEQIALKRCSGKILDVGAGAGCHAKWLKQQGLEVSLIELSKGAVEYHITQELNSRCIDFFDLKGEQYDTLLFLMNGIGIGGELKNLERTLRQAYELTTPKGKVLCDSSDLRYLYEDDEGGYWVNLNAEYYGEYDFQMQYKETQGDWFKWLYVDFHTLSDCAEKVGFSVELLYDKDYHYLVELTKK